MSLKRDWLWDRKITIKMARHILNDPKNKHFLSLSNTLLSRKNTPKEVFRHYLKPLIFFQNWQKIKRRMRKDEWSNPRIEFWQAIYEKLKEKYEKKGISPIGEVVIRKPENKFCKSVANNIRIVRKQKGLTQSELAKRLKVSQQLISRIEKGRENISLLTLKRILDTLGAEIRLEVS